MPAWYPAETMTEGRTRLDNCDLLRDGYDGRLPASRRWVRQLLAMVLPIALSDIYKRLRVLEQAREAD